MDCLSFDNVFLEADIAQGIIFRGRIFGINHDFTMDFDPAGHFIEKFGGGVQLYIVESTDFFSIISFELKNENGNLVSFKGQSITFPLSIKEV